mmetsp:Transcript_48662/g.89209  ORF Transcript_48662/g.89209 Transcript_48662/m.89209 type:complete len:317 (-) Transcript_48662:34-984(-)
MVKFALCNDALSNPVCLHFWEAATTHSKLPGMIAPDSLVGVHSGRRAHASFLAAPGSKFNADLADAQLAKQSGNRGSGFLAFKTPEKKPPAHFSTAFADRILLADVHHIKDIHADDIEDLADPDLPPPCKRWRVTEGLHKLRKAVPALFEEPHPWVLGTDPPLAQLPEKLKTKITEAVKPLQTIIEDLSERMYHPQKSEQPNDPDIDRLKVETDAAKFFAEVDPKYTKQVEDMEKVLREVSHKPMSPSTIDSVSRWRIQLTLDGLADAAKDVHREMRLCEKVRPTADVLGNHTFNIRSGMQNDTLTWDLGKDVDVM